MRFSFAEYLLAGGVVLGIVGLILWRVLPIPARVPPFLLTSLLAMGYGGYETWRRRRSPRP